MKMRRQFGKRKFPWKGPSTRLEGMVDTPLKIGISRRVSRLAGYGTVQRRGHSTQSGEKDEGGGVPSRILDSRIRKCIYPNTRGNTRPA